MDLQEYLDWMSIEQQKLRSSEMFTLGDLIRELKKYPANNIVLIEPFDLIPLDFDSYRGYYEDLALGYGMDVAEQKTLGVLLWHAEHCVGHTFIGYKGGGGLFTMAEKTPLWVSNYGECSDVAIANVTEERGRVLINCYRREEK